MATQRIPKVTPIMLREQPDQFCTILNMMIDKINKTE